MTTKAEEIASSCLRTILAPLAPGSAIGESQAFLEFQSALEVFLPALLAETHAWWRGESMDAFRFFVARKLGPRAAEFIGLCLLITDQTWTPVRLRLRVSPHGDTFDFIDFNVGEVGTESGGMVRTPCSREAELLDSVERRIDSIAWTYAIKRSGDALDVHDAVLNFHRFLNAGFAAWSRAADAARDRDRMDDEGFDDWAQANWELLVERAICGIGEFLEIYGSGSDYEADRHSRVFFHRAIPTHEIACVAADGAQLREVVFNPPVEASRCTFEGFVARVGDWYDAIPPFDHVLLEQDGNESVVPLAAVRFVMRRILGENR